MSIERPEFFGPGGHSHSTEVDGGAPVAMRIRLSGELGRNFLDFVANRAAWLSLSGWAESRSDGQAIVVAAGSEALVGALEMACLLGPIGSLVHTLETEPELLPVLPGFAIRG